jgi:hypothetical protein
MKRTVAMLFISIMVFAVVFAGFCGAESFVAASPASAPKVITDKSAFIEAVNKAKDGDTIYVGDIDFTVDEGLNPASRMTVSKSVVIRNGKSDCNAIFSGFSLILSGTKVSGDKMTFVMDGIDFDGGIDGLTLTKEDWLLPQNSQGEYTSTEPVKAQYAVTFSATSTQALTTAILHGICTITVGRFGAVTAIIRRTQIYKCCTVITEVAGWIYR